MQYPHIVIFIGQQQVFFLERVLMLVGSRRIVSHEHQQAGQHLTIVGLGLGTIVELVLTVRTYHLYFQRRDIPATPGYSSTTTVPT